MDENAICDLCTPRYAALVEDIRDAVADFDHLVNPAAQPSLLPARAKITSCRLMHRVAERYGRNTLDPIRVQEISGMNVLVVQGDDFDVGLRLKKYDGNYRTFNHQSDQQDDLRRDGRFPQPSIPGMDTPLAHVFIGYRSTEGLQPRIRDIALSFEGATFRGRYYVEWFRVIWTPDDGFEPRQRGTPPLFPPDLPTYDIKPKRASGSKRRKSSG